MMIDYKFSYVSQQQDRWEVVIVFYSGDYQAVTETAIDNTTVTHDIYKRVSQVKQMMFHFDTAYTRNQIVSYVNTKIAGLAMKLGLQVITEQT